MQTRYTARQVCLMQRLRQLREQHVYRTRFFIISTAAGLADLAPVTERLLQNPKDFARALTPFFGAAHGRRYVLRSGHALPLNAQALPTGMTPEGSAFSQNCAGCTTGGTLRCLPLPVKEERTLACTQSANSGVDR